MKILDRNIRDSNITLKVSKRVVEADASVCVCAYQY